MSHSVAITGLGVVTAQGIGLDATWTGIVEGRDRLQSWTRAPASLRHLKVAECPPLHPPTDLPARLWNRLSRTQQLGCIAMDEALASAKLPSRPASAPPIGLFLATTVCGMDRNEQFYEEYRLNPEGADVELMRRIEPFGVETLISRRHGVGAVGMNQVCLSTCVGSAMAIGSACDAIALGECELAIAGGSEAMCRVVLSGFHSLKVVAPEGCRPFDKDRPGITVGEGAGILVLESVEHAKRRGVKPLAYVRGFGVTCDAHHITAPDPAGTQAMRAIREALNRAGMTAADIDYVNAHGTGTRDNDNMETRALRGALMTAEGRLPLVSSTKRCTGHTFGAAGATEAIVCVQAIRHGIAPGNVGSVEGDPALELPIVRGGSRAVEIRAALSTNFAFGGNNTALIFSRDAGGVND